MNGIYLGLVRSAGKASRLILLTAAYAAILFVALLSALLLRFDFAVPADFWTRFWYSLLWILPLKLALLAVFGQFRSLLTYFSLPDAKRIGAALVTAGIIEAAVWVALAGAMVIPRGVIASDVLLSFLALGGFRVALRLYREQTLSGRPEDHQLGRRRVAIIGAGSAGAALVRDIQSRQGLGLEVVCFIDDDQTKIGNRLHGKPVLGPTRKLAEIAESLDLKKVIIAMPTAKPTVIKQLVSQINEAGLDHDILPSVDQLLRRKVTVEHLRHVSPEDLLGREPVQLDDAAIAGLIKGRVVLVTGGGGSIGSELCRQIASHAPAKLIVIERAEPSLFSIEQELRRDFGWLDTIPLAASVCNPERIGSVFEIFRPNLVFHAAAHKHVPLMEAQPAEAVLNNAIGTMIVAEAARKHGCERFVLVSTDKAVNPTNVMGATKRLAELVINGLQHSSNCATRFCSVRFGNVLGSSGSVIPTFRQQITSGGPVTVTHPDVIRYFMSIPEAVGLILQSATLAEEGDVFVLDMGEPIRIQDLARQMIELCGFVPDEEIKIEFIGLRPGEKLFEETIHKGENIVATSHPKIHRLINDLRARETLEALKGIQEAKLYSASSEEIKNWLAQQIPEYKVWEN
ncbi:MAG: nucleoside-diphosphate sugar epimerase/dehydratase [Verrucomicrobiae bacterium]